MLVSLPIFVGVPRAVPVSLVLSAGTLTAGTYWVRVFDVGPNTATNQTVQLYDLTMRVGAGAGAKAPPVAVAGLHKRIQAGKSCFFFGDINSYTTDTGPTGGANTLSYFWDLDGNGVFGGGIDSSSAQPVVTGGYVSNGAYPVTLRVTDSNGLTSTDTINVVVYGATATIASVTPSSADPGTSVPVTITGVNFKGVNSAAQFSVSGTGVTVTGTPVVNALGTQVTGLSLVVAAGATGSARDVIVTNSDGSGTASGNATGVGKFTVNGACSPPTILAQPQSLITCPGGTVTFNVGASAGSGGPVTYQWRKDTAPISGATNSYLSLPNISVANQGAYDCVVSNPCGPTTSNSATLAFDSAGISQQPAPQSACLGGTATFSIGVQGTADLQWRKNLTDIPGATGPSLVIAPVGPGDVGAYDCTLTTGCDFIISDSVQLTVGGGASIQVQPATQSVCEGTPVTLNFGVDGATGYQWRKGGQDIPGATSSTLSFPSASLSDAADYDCVAASPCGGATSSVATLSVCSSVSIGTQPSAGSACPGGSKTFTVGATGSSLTYQWRKGGTPIAGANGTSLTISPVGAGSVGSYDCVVGNCCQQAATVSVGLTVCVADYNCSGAISVDDIFDFLNSWFAGAASADVNGIDGLTVQDIFKTDEIASVIKQEIAQYAAELEISEVGRVVEVGDGIARIYGLAKAMAGEMLEFQTKEGTVIGQVFNLELDTVGAVIYGDYLSVKEGDLVKSTGRLLQVPVGESLLGRVVDPLGRTLDDGPALNARACGRFGR